MLKRWDTRNYDIEFILTIFDFISIDIKSMNIPKPKKYDIIKTIIKALIIEESGNLSLRATEVRVKSETKTSIWSFN